MGNDETANLRREIEREERMLECLAGGHVSEFVGGFLLDGAFAMEFEDGVGRLFAQAFPEAHVDVLRVREIAGSRETGEVLKGRIRDAARIAASDF